jgi:hypothetical protein
MFGNKEGWILSAVIVGLMGWMLLKMGRLEPMSEPSGQFSNLREPIKLPVAPADALPGVMTADRDAGDDYWKAVELYRQFPTDYKKFEPKNLAKVTRLPALNVLLDAAPAKKASIFIKRPALLVNYKSTSPELQVLADLGQLAASIGHYYATKGADEKLAERYLNAAFSLGAKLYDERVTHEELLEGIKLMRGATASLRVLEKGRGNAAREQALAKFDNETSAYYSTEVQPLYGKVVAVGGADVRRYAGDVFDLAMHSPERMWRTEAFLKVGRMKSEKGGSRSDQIWAKRLLTQPQRLGVPDATKDADPAVSHAATVARDLSGLSQVAY